MSSEIGVNIYGPGFSFPRSLFKVGGFFPLREKEKERNRKNEGEREWERKNKKERVKKNKQERDFGVRKGLNMILSIKPYSCMDPYRNGSN